MRQCVTPPFRGCFFLPPPHCQPPPPNALEKLFADISESNPALLAYHFAEAGLSVPACDYRMRAGDQAVSRSAYPEAIAHFSTGLKLAQALPAQDGMRRQLDFLLKLGSAAVVAHGSRSGEAEQSYARATEIGQKLCAVPQFFQAKLGLWINANFRGSTALP